MKTDNNFLWGVNSSSFQCENDLHLGDRGPSIWDDCTSVYPGLKGVDIEKGPRYIQHIDEDIKLLKELGVKCYRLSLSWTRIIPDGIGRVSEFGVKLYQDWIKKLIDNGITPYVNLFHWDYPLALEKLGGWKNPDSPKWYAYYASVVGKMFDGLVKDYIVYNEPQCFTELAYNLGIKAPFEHLQRDQILDIIHNSLVAGALACKELRKASSIKLNIGVAETFNPAFPDDENNPEDVKLAMEYNDKFHEDYYFVLDWFADPAYLGTYPEDYLRVNKFKRDPKECYADFDFIGLNIYTGKRIKAVDGKPVVIHRDGVYRNQMGWECEPECMYWGIKYAHEKYHKPIIVTESGTSCDDKLIDGKVHDQDRITYINDYLSEVLRAKEDGCDVRGYFVWSFTDNFEWELGYKIRIGLVYIDYEDNAKRYKKDSYYFYQDVIKNNASNLAKKKLPFNL